MNIAQVHVGTGTSGAAFVENANYLKAGIFTKQVYEPVVEILGPCLHGFIFELEYLPKSDRFPQAKLAQDLDKFLSPSDELRGILCPSLPV